MSCTNLLTQSSYTDDEIKVLSEQFEDATVYDYVQWYRIIGYDGRWDHKFIGSNLEYMLSYPNTYFVMDERILPFKSQVFTEVDPYKHLSTFEPAMIVKKITVGYTKFGVLDLPGVLIRNGKMFALDIC